jgi:Na+/H+-dicarboxylate symporter
MKKENILTLAIVIGLVAGAAVGELAFYRPNRERLSTVRQLEDAAWKAAIKKVTADLQGQKPDDSQIKAAAAKIAPADRLKLLPAADQQRFAKADEALGFFRDGIDIFQFIGETFFMNLLKMVLIPLVVSSVIVGVASIDPSQMGKVGGLTVLYYFTTMAIAVILGVILVTTFRPGDNFDQEFRAAQVAQYERQLAEGGTAQKRVAAASGTGLWGAFKNLVTQMLPKNPVGDAASGKILPTIAFSLIFGIVLTLIGPKGETVKRFFEGFFEVIMRLVDWILWLAPLGVASLVAWTVARIGIDELIVPLAKYVAVVLAGLFIHGAVILPLILWVFGRTNPYRYMWQMKPALMTAFGTDSSSATLPVTIDTAQEAGGVSKRASEFVLPLGATVNMDGTALYEAVAVVFLFQCFSIELSFMALAIVVITATLAAVGAAGIPSAGLVTMVIVVEAVNGALPADKMLPLAAIGIILGIDRILDMCRTTVNVWGDAVGAKLISPLAPDLPSDAPSDTPELAVASSEPSEKPDDS